ncbi:MAG: hypothetical protein MJ060_01860 [Clostridia bacterium]|nr:hypothetical protein [Clostridia bacterium]
MVTIVNRLATVSFPVVNDKIDDVADFWYNWMFIAETNVLIFLWSQCHECYFQKAEKA